MTFNVHTEVLHVLKIKIHWKIILPQETNVFFFFLDSSNLINTFNFRVNPQFHLYLFRTIMT